MAKGFATFLLMPVFLVSIPVGFTKAAHGRHVPYTIGFDVVLVLILVAYLALAHRMFRRYQFPDLQWRNVALWLALWVVLYGATVGFISIRLGYDRSHWVDLIGMDAYLWLITLPWSAWTGLRKAALSVG